MPGFRRWASILMFVGLSGCEDQGPELFEVPVEVPVVPGLVAAFSGISFSFPDGAVFEPRLAGAPLALVFTSATTFRAEGNGTRWEGTITFPTTSGSSPFAAPAAGSGSAPQPVNPIFQIFLWWFGEPNPAPDSYGGTGFELVTMTFSSPTAGQLGLNNALSGFFNTPNSFDFQACIIGISTRVGPDGTTTAPYDSSACS